MSETMATFDKVKWTRKYRREFALTNGYSTRANQGAGRLRAAVLARDDFRCVLCGMSNDEHVQKWGPITIDHIDRNRKNNTMENLQTLCQKCHGKKDHVWRSIPRTSKAIHVKAEILSLRAGGLGQKRIGKTLGIDARVIGKWLKRWKGVVHDPIVGHQWELSPPL